ncbi:monofunctional biosynthetic peptidoglycan transglycosylase [mine drainage metagenome]|uniref:Monofunctional biosynthetic peptidoglycan transglycosylase n=1 Tax=mine drainage metagenome TaxID=410659 RepID=A0A1J5RDQ9_9ZZZZ
MAKPSARPSLRSIAWLCFWAAVILQGYFALRVLAWTVTTPSSTAFMRAAQLRILRGGQDVAWQHAWTPYDRISPWLKRAVVASEDATFLTNDGVDWDAIRDAWIKNHSRRDERLHRVVGGSTITQQLAKNLFLSPQRSYVRKAQELIITFMLEGILGKRRILEIYLNSVEWGDGLYGAQAASQHYFHVPAARLSPWQAARLAVMLPAPRFFQRHLYGPYINSRTGAIAARAYDVQIPR